MKKLGFFQILSALLLINFCAAAEDQLPAPWDAYFRAQLNISNMVIEVDTNPNKLKPMDPSTDTSPDIYSITWQHNAFKIARYKDLRDALEPGLVNVMAVVTRWNNHYSSAGFGQRNSWENSEAADLFHAQLINSTGPSLNFHLPFPYGQVVCDGLKYSHTNQDGTECQVQFTVKNGEVKNAWVRNVFRPSGSDEWREIFWRLDFLDANPFPKKVNQIVVEKGREKLIRVLTIHRLIFSPQPLGEEAFVIGQLEGHYRPPIIIKPPRFTLTGPHAAYAAIALSLALLPMLLILSKRRQS